MLVIATSVQLIMLLLKVLGIVARMQLASWGGIPLGQTNLAGPLGMTRPMSMGYYLRSRAGYTPRAIHELRSEVIPGLCGDANDHMERLGMTAHPRRNS